TPPAERPAHENSALGAPADRSEDQRVVAMAPKEAVAQQELVTGDPGADDNHTDGAATKVPAGLPVTRSGNLDGGRGAHQNTAASQVATQEASMSRRVAVDYDDANDAPAARLKAFVDKVPSNLVECGPLVNSLVRQLYPDGIRVVEASDDSALGRGGMRAQ